VDAVLLKLFAVIESPRQAIVTELLKILPACRRFDVLMDWVVPPKTPMIRSFIPADVGCDKALPFVSAIYLVTPKSIG
jgi:hypothetical protein